MSKQIHQHYVDGIIKFGQNLSEWEENFIDRISNRLGAGS